MEGDIIIPKIIHSNVNLFLADKNFDKNHLSKMPKPWAEYIASDIEYSVLKCISTFRFEQFNDIRNCIFKDLPSYKIFQDILKHPCPHRRQISSVKSTVFVYNHELTNASRIRSKAGRIMISTDKCPILLGIYLTHLKDSHHGLGVRYNFFTDGALRVNVTFIHLEILKGESVQLLNLNDEIKSKEMKSKNYIEVGKGFFSNGDTTHSRFPKPRCHLVNFVICQIFYSKLANCTQL